MKCIITFALLISSIAVSAQNYTKMSSYVRQSLTQHTSSAAKAKAKGVSNKVPEMTVFVKATDTDVLKNNGCKIYAQWDNIYIASMPMDKIGTLSMMPQIQRIEAGQSCSITNDTTATITRTRDVWNFDGNQTTLPLGGLRGADVVVGVMDIGFDLTHPTFYSSDGKTYRIKQFWDQLDQTQGGEPVIGTDTIYVGRQYVGQEALLALQHSYDGLTQYHGTHTAGTAAGSGWQGTLDYLPPLGRVGVGFTLNSYSGMSPDADICLVCNAAGDNADLIPDEEKYKYTTATDMLGFKYIFDYADKVGKPCVINFSEGAHDDLWESGLYSEVLSKMIGPGHILCASAGNEGNGNGTYIHKAIGESGKGAFLAKWSSNTAVYVMRSQKPVQMRLSFYKDRKKVLDKDYDLTSLADYPDSLMYDPVVIDKDTMLVALETYPSCFDETLFATDFFLIDKNHERCGDDIPTSITLLGEDNDIEAFCAGGYFIRRSLDASLADFDRTHNILFPGSAKDVICVGNSSYRTTFMNTEGVWHTPSSTDGKDGVISIYSSVGPAINGEIKPDVVAPGKNIISSYNSFFREDNPMSGRSDDVQEFTYEDRKYQWHACSGTSMSTPVVTGIIALWLQVCPTLTPDQIKDVIAHTSSHYDSSMTFPNNQYGWGQIDAWEGVKYIQNVYTGIAQIENEGLKHYNTDGTYTLDGMKVGDAHNRHGIFIHVKDGKIRKVTK